MLRYRITGTTARRTRAAQAAKPSILHVGADDLGYFDLGYKNKRTHSPTIDALAAGGIHVPLEVLLGAESLPVLEPAVQEKVATLHFFRKLTAGLDSVGRSGINIWIDFYSDKL